MRIATFISFVSLASLMFVSTQCSSQPFIDLVNIQCIHSPDLGLINREKNAVRLTNFSVQTTIPFQLKNKKDVIIFSPFFDIWTPEIKSVNKDFTNQYGIGLPVSFLKALADTNWSILSTIILRKNGFTISSGKNWQIGGALITNYKANETVTYKAGIYLNKEFFGLFVMPLLGIDWQINKNTNLFGILPGSMTLEHRLRKNFWAGACFKAITNSYKTNSGYWRLDENRLGIFCDFYLSKQFVLTAETGHTILRKMRTGIDDKNYNNWKVNDNAYMKIGLAYRLRFR